MGRTAHVTVALIALWGMVFWTLPADFGRAALAVGAALVPTAICVWWIIKTHQFAEKNPGLALLEGAELLKYQKFEAEMRGGSPKFPAASANVADGRQR